MEGVYDRTGLCPYTGDCDSYRSIVNGERWMERALSEMRREGMDSLSQAEGGYSEHDLQGRIAHLRRVKDRCFSSNGRCLRFWQFERKNKHNMSLSSLKKKFVEDDRALDPMPVRTFVQRVDR
jgi:hypothetical protein